MSWSAASSRGKLFSDHGIQQNLCSSAVKTNADSRQDLFTGSPQPQVGCSHPSFLLSFFASPTNKPKLLNPSLQSHRPGCSAICLLVMGSQGEGERTDSQDAICLPTTTALLRWQPKAWTSDVSFREILYLDFFVSSPCPAPQSSKCQVC